MRSPSYLQRPDHRYAGHRF